MGKGKAKAQHAKLELTTAELHININIIPNIIIITNIAWNAGNYVCDNFCL